MTAAYSIISGLFLIAVTFSLFIIFEQAYKQDLYPKAIRDGVDATNLTLINTTWGLILVPITLSIVVQMMRSGRNQTGGLYQDA